MQRSSSPVLIPLWTAGGFLIVLSFPAVSTSGLDFALQVASLVPTTGNARDVNSDWVQHHGMTVQHSSRSASG